MLDRSSYPPAAGPFTNGNGNGVPHGSLPHAPLGAQKDEEVSLREVLEVLLKGKWIVLSCFVVVLAVTALYTFNKAPVYEASSLLLVNSQQSSPQLGEMLGLELTNRNVLNEIEILKSRTLATRVATEILAREYAPGTGQTMTALDPGESAEPVTELSVAQRLRKDYVNIKPVNAEVDLIQVTAQSTIPEEAAFIATQYATAYVDYNRAKSRKVLTASRQFLNGQTERFDSMLVLAEQRMMQFAEEQGIVDPDEEQRYMLGQTAQLTAKKYEAEFALETANAELTALEEQLNAIKPGLARTLSFNDDEVITGLRARVAALYLEIEETLTKHPGLRGLNADQVEATAPELAQLAVKMRQLEGFGQQLSNRTDEFTRNVLADENALGQGTTVQGAMEQIAKLQQQILEKKTQMSGAQARLDVLDDELLLYRRELNKMPNTAILFTRFQREMVNNAQLYSTMYERLQEARVAEQSELGYVEIIDEAVVPNKPVSPQIPLNLLLGAVIGLMMGVGVAFLRNAWDNKVRKPEDLRRHGHSVIGVIPDMDRVVKEDFEGRERVVIDGHSYSTSLIVLLNPMSPIAEGYRRLRTNIQFSRPDKTVQTIMVTSAGPGEGKTVTSINLAITMAQSGRRTIYVDADMRRATGHRMMGISREPGLVDLLFEAYPGEVERFSTSIDDLYIVPAGRVVPNPAEILGSQKMRDLMTRLATEFDVVIIDTPPILAVTDALLLSTQCDATLLVCSANETNWHFIDRSAEAIRDVGARVTGVVLNRFDPKAAFGSYGSAYGYGYGYGYGSGYGYGYGDGSSAHTEGVVPKPV